MRIAWVIGARGLLGQAVSTEIGRRDDWTLLEADPLPWGETTALSTQVAKTAKRLVDAAAAAKADWTIVWAAGAAVTASSPEQLAAEGKQLDRVLAAIAKGTAGAARGSIFYASSAGGIYAGSPTAPYTEESPTAPISPYGQFKLRAESTIAAFAAQNGMSSLLGRIANLYGPGQKLDKMQGLISQIAKAQFSPAPAAIFVPLDTMRDYIFVNDCAALVLDGLDRLGAPTKPQHVVKILASGTGVTIASLLGQFRQLSKSSPHVMLGSSPASTFQVRDLRMRSTVWPELDARTLTPLAAGIHATLQDMLLSIQASTTR